MVGVFGGFWLALMLACVFAAELVVGSAPECEPSLATCTVAVACTTGRHGSHTGGTHLC
jgi:hypothetical protein